MRYYYNTQTKETKQSINDDFRTKTINGEKVLDNTWVEISQEHYNDLQPVVLRYFKHKQTGELRTASKEVQSVLTEILTPTLQVGTQIIEGKEYPVYESEYEEITEQEYDALKPKEPEPIPPTYEEKVNNMIRERYSLSEELAILRQRDNKPEEYKQYYDYCEKCKKACK